MIPVYSRSSFAAFILAACMLLSVFIAFSCLLNEVEASESVPQEAVESVSDNSVGLDPVLDKLEDVDETTQDVVYAVIMIGGVIVGVFVCFLIFR